MWNVSPMKLMPAVCKLCRRPLDLWVDHDLCVPALATVESCFCISCALSNPRESGVCRVLLYHSLDRALWKWLSETDSVWDIAYAY